MALSLLKWKKKQFAELRKIKWWIFVFTRKRAVCSGRLNFNPRWILERPIVNLESFDSRVKNSDNSTIRVTSRERSLSSSPQSAIVWMKWRTASIPRPDLPSPLAPAEHCSGSRRDCGLRAGERTATLPDTRVPGRGLGRGGPCREPPGHLFRLPRGAAAPAGTLCPCSPARGPNSAALDFILLSPQGGLGGLAWRCGWGTRG